MRMKGACALQRVAERSPEVPVVFLITTESFPMAIGHTALIAIGIKVTVRGMVTHGCLLSGPLFQQRLFLIAAAQRHKSFYKDSLQGLLAEALNMNL